MVRKPRTQKHGIGRAVGATQRALAVALAVACGACEDEAAQTHKGSSSVATVAEDERPEWLGLTEDMLPEDWLVHRRLAPRAEIASQDVEAARALLVKASGQFGDNPRMIANRAAQLEAMLADKGHREDALELIETLMRAAPGSRPTGGFGQICQYYFNLRAQGLDRAHALAALSERYGPSG